METPVLSIEPSSLVLVCVMNNRRDFDIARIFGWYRIPLRSSPKVVAVDYLAFYQTAGFDEQSRWRISYTAKVRGYELLTRAEILKDEPDHPHAHEEYFKVQIGSLMRLPQSIDAGSWKRVTFLYTTGNRLVTARTIKDLVVRDDERTVLWKSLRERALAGGYPSADLAEDAFEVDPMLKAALFGLAGGMKDKGHG